MLQHLQTRVDKFYQRVLAIRFAPHGGVFWEDALAVLVLAMFQAQFLAQFLPHFLSFDILAMWVLVILVQQHPLQALCLGALGFFTLETHTSAPRGLYLCPFLVFAFAIFQIRQNITWRKWVSWVTMFALFEGVLLGFELLFSILKMHSTEQISVILCLQLLLRWVGTVLFGMFLVYFFHFFAPEDLERESRL